MREACGDPTAWMLFVREMAVLCSLVFECADDFSRLFIEQRNEERG